MTHRHDMKDLEQEIIIDDNIYSTWCCFDRDCNYHEHRYKYPAPPKPAVTIQDMEKGREKLIKFHNTDEKIQQWIDKNVIVADLLPTVEDRGHIDPNSKKWGQLYTKGEGSKRISELIDKAIKDMYKQGYDPSIMDIEAVNDPTEPFTIKFIAVPRKT